MIVDEDFVIINNLLPSTTYNIGCKAISTLNDTFKAFSKLQMIITKPAILDIIEAKRHGDYIVVQLDTNLENTISCALYGGSNPDDIREAVVSDALVSFRVENPSADYTVQCNARNADNQCNLFCFVVQKID